MIERSSICRRDPPISRHDERPQRRRDRHLETRHRGIRRRGRRSRRRSRRRPHHRNVWPPRKSLSGLAISTRANPSPNLRSLSSALLRRSDRLKFTSPKIRWTRPETSSFAEPDFSDPVWGRTKGARVSALLVGGMPGWVGDRGSDRAGRGREPPKRRCWGLASAELSTGCTR